MENNRKGMVEAAKAQMNTSGETSDEDVVDIASPHPHALKIVKKKGICFRRRHIGFRSPLEDFSSSTHQNQSPTGRVNVEVTFAKDEVPVRSVENRPLFSQLAGIAVARAEQ